MPSLRAGLSSYIVPSNTDFVNVEKGLYIKLISGYHIQYMDLQAILTATVTFINSTLIPFLMAIAFFFFIWNAFRYFIIGGSNPDSQEKARSLAIWGILGFVVIVSLWGIVNIFSNSFGIDDAAPITPDYMGGRVTDNLMNQCSDPFSSTFNQATCCADSVADLYGGTNPFSGCYSSP